MPGQNIWTISNTSPNQSAGNDLNGCHIVQTATGYNLTEPNINNVLSSSTDSPPSFNDFTYDDLTWYVSVNSPLTPGANGSGNWGCEFDPSVRPEGDPTEEGTFTAQAGSGMTDDAEAASANA